MKRFLFPLFLLFLNCVYIPKYVNVGEAICTEGEANAVVKKLYPDSTIHIQAHYSNGAVDSIVTFFPTGIRSSITRFKNGLFENYSEEFYANGKVKSSVLFTNGIEVYRSRADFDSLGNVLFEWIDKPKKVSIYKSKYPTGEKKFEFEYKDSIPNGYHIQWRPNGSTVFKCFYINGKQDYTKTYLLDSEGRKVNEIVRTTLFSQIPAYRGIYNQYLSKNRMLGGEAKIYLMLVKSDKKMWSILLTNDFNCKELVDNINEVIMHQEYAPISFSGHEYFAFILPLKFRKY